MPIEYDKDRNNSLLRNYGQERNRRNLGEKWHEATQNFRVIRSKLKMIPKAKRMALAEEYFYSLDVNPRLHYSVTRFFKRPSLRGLGPIMDIMPVLNNDDADNLNLIVRGIRNIIDN